MNIIQWHILAQFEINALNKQISIISRHHQMIRIAIKIRARRVSKFCLHRFTGRELLQVKILGQEASLVPSWAHDIRI